MNHYLNKIRRLSVDKEKANEYIAFCEHALYRDKISGYVEKHHMLPKCICVNDLEKTDKENLVIFTAKEHFIAHQLLSEMFGGQIKRKMMYALSGLCFKKNGNRIVDADEYAIIKEASRIAKRGIPLTEKHRQKIRDSFAEHNPNIGRKVSNEIKEKQSNAKIGIHCSQSVKESISNALKGIPKGPQPLLSCIICRKSGGSHAIKQHHYNKCTQGV